MYLSTQKKSLFVLLFKVAPFDRKSLEDSRNFANALGVIAYVRDIGKYLVPLI